MSNTDGGSDRDDSGTPQCVTKGCERLADGISDMCGPCAEAYAREYTLREMR